jgi:DNA-binding NarL/FixJ family response regulator
LEYIIEALRQIRPGKIGQPGIAGILSKREQEVSRLVVAGLSNREIAESLSLSEHTIKNYLFRIFEKVGVSTRTELVLHMLSEAKPAERERKDQSPARKMSA